MTSKDLLAAIGGLDEKDLIRAQKKRISPLVWLVTAAAVLLGLFLLIHRERPVYHTVLEEKPGWNMNAAIPAQHRQPQQPDDYTLFAQDFQENITVHARLAEVLPDIYLIPEKSLNRTTYRVLRLQIVDTLAGENVPKELFFLLPEQYSTELQGYDLLIALEQLGVEDYLLLNTTKAQYETFSLLFACRVSSHEKDEDPDPTKASVSSGLSILPFRNGVVSWPQDIWWSTTQNSFQYCAKQKEPVNLSPTLEETKAAIRKARAGNNAVPKVRYADEYNIGILLTDADTPKEGVFSQIIHQQDGKILLCRIIDGFYANECYMYYEDGRIEASDITFTREDIAQLPNLTPAVEQALAKAPASGTCRKFVGYYYKTDSGKLFGVVQAHWEIDWETSVTVNLMVMPDGTIRQVTAGELDSYLQNG